MNLYRSTVILVVKHPVHRACLSIMYACGLRIGDAIKEHLELLEERDRWFMSLDLSRLYRSRYGR